MAASNPNYAYRPNAQLSANQIAEYLYATPSRRRKIIQDARFPKRSVVARYKPVRNCLADFLTDGTRSERHLAAARDKLSNREARPSATDWVKEDCRLSLEAINAFERSYNRLNLASIRCDAIRGRLPWLKFGASKISVSLDAITRSRNMDGDDAIGGIVFLISRGEQSDRQRIDRCKTIAGLIYEFCRLHMNNQGVADPALCRAIDVFQQKSHRTPGTFVRKRRHIEDACDEIASRWRSISPPSGYDGPAPY